MATTTAQTGYLHITKDPRVCGGKPCIDKTRIRVMDIVGLHQAGYTPEQMLNVYATPLTLAQVHAALAYYYDHPEEIEENFAEDDRIEAEIEREQAEHVNRPAKD